MVVFSPQFLDHIKDRVRLSDIIQKTVGLKKKGTTFLGLCPFHQEKTPSFTVDDQKHFYHCFGCGTHGDVFEYLMTRENMNFPEAVEHAAGMAGLPMPSPEVQEEITKKVDDQKILLDIMEQATQWFESNLKKPEGRGASLYLKERGIASHTQKHFRLGYAPNKWDGLIDFFKAKGTDLKLLEQAGLAVMHEGKKPFDNFHHRVIFPITNKKGQVVAFGGRSLDGSEPKYLNTKETPIFHKGHILYNWKEARSQKKEMPLIVAEGYMDVLVLWQYGYPRSVAPLGTAVTESHLKELWAIHPNPIFCLDGDSAGRRAELKAIQRALPLLLPGFTLSFISLPQGEDPDTYLQHEGSKGFDKLVENATSLVDCLFHREFEIHNPKTPDKKALFEKNLLNYVQLIKDPYVQSHYGQALRETLYKWKGSLRQKKFSHTKAATGSGMQAVPGEGTKKAFDHLVMREKIMLGIILTNPSILPEIFEEFSSIIFKDPTCEKVKEEILGYFSQNKALEKTELRSYLGEVDLNQEVEAIFETRVLMHASFLKMDLDSKILKEHWDEVCSLYQKEILQLEIHQLERDLVHDLSPETWARYQAFKALLTKEGPKS